MEHFKSKFLNQYLRLGIGSMPKADIDALMMHLLDEYGGADNKPLKTKSNYDVSKLLKVSSSKIRTLRLNASLKFYENIEAEAKARFESLIKNKIAFEYKQSKIKLIIEDALVKDWLEGQLKANNLFFGLSTNKESIELKAEDLFELAKSILQNDKQLSIAYSEYLKLKGQERNQKNVESIKKIITPIFQEVLISSIKLMTTIN